MHQKLIIPIHHVCFSHLLFSECMACMMYVCCVQRKLPMKHANFHLVLVLYIILTWFRQVQLYQPNNNELYWNIFARSHTERKPITNEQREKDSKWPRRTQKKKNHFSSKTKGRVHRSVQIFVVAVVRGECIEMELTDIFHSISDFTIQFNNKKRGSITHMRSSFCTPFSFLFPYFVPYEATPSPSPVAFWVLSVITVASFHLLPFCDCVRYACKWVYRTQRHLDFFSRLSSIFKSLDIAWKKVPYRMLDDILVNIYLNCTAHIIFHLIDQQCSVFRLAF